MLVIIAELIILISIGRMIVIISIDVLTNLLSPRPHITIRIQCEAYFLSLTGNFLDRCILR